MSHKCFATKCTKNCSDKFLMCRPHWFMVPQAIRTRVMDGAL